ncbi:MAG: hypothetical protein Fur0039_10910 [Rhodocyclaceae bacterium]
MRQADPGAGPRPVGSGATTRHRERSDTVNVGDVMICIDESLTPEARTSLEQPMRPAAGVVSARFRPGREHLLMVSFDTGKTRSAVLLAKAREAGHGARLVGMREGGSGRLSRQEARR